MMIMMMTIETSPRQKLTCKECKKMDSEPQCLLKPLNQTELDRYPASGLFSDMNS